MSRLRQRILSELRSQETPAQTPRHSLSAAGTVFDGCSTTATPSHWPRRRVPSVLPKRFADNSSAERRLVARRSRSVLIYSREHFISHATFYNIEYFTVCYCCLTVYNIIRGASWWKKKKKLKPKRPNQVYVCSSRI